MSDYTDSIYERLDKIYNSTGSVKTTERRIKALIREVQHHAIHVERKRVISALEGLGNAIDAKQLDATLKIVRETL